MQRRGVAPRRSASAGAGLRLGASANAAAGNAAHLGLDLLTPLALALGAAEVETQAKAARQIRDLTREGSVSCAAASKSGAVNALVALATRQRNDIAEADERLAADGEKATRLDKATQLSSPTNVVCFWACARDAADALTALGCMEHRGACSADDDSGDGAGIMCNIPWKMLGKYCEEKGIAGFEEGKSGVGMVFLPQDKAQAAKNILLWNKAGGKVLRGLVRRREAEKALFLTPVEAPRAPPATEIPKQGAIAALIGAIAALFLWRKGK